MNPPERSSSSDWQVLEDSPCWGGFFGCWTVKNPIFCLSLRSCSELLRVNCARWLSSLSLRVSYRCGSANLRRSRPGNLILIAESRMGGGGGIATAAGAEIFRCGGAVSSSAPAPGRGLCGGGAGWGGVTARLGRTSVRSLSCRVIILGMAPRLLPAASLGTSTFI